MRKVVSLVACLLFAAGAIPTTAERPVVARFGILDAARYNLYASPKSLPIAKAISEGERLYRAEEYAKAQAAFKALQAMEGADTIKLWAACMEGMCLAYQEKYDDARTIIKKAVDADPKSADANLADYAIGATYKLAYDDDKAIAHFDTYLDNPDRKADTNYYDRALEWQTEQYRSRTATAPNDAKVKARFYQLLDAWVRAHPDRLSDYPLLYKFFRDQDRWSDCARVAGYKMNPTEAAISVLRDQLAKAQDICAAATLGAAEAAKAAKPRIEAVQAEFAKLKDLPLDTRRALTFQLIQTFIMCGTPEDGDKAALEWMAANPTDRTALYMYIGHVRAAKAARPEALDRIVGDFLRKKPADDVRMEMLELYADVAVPIYEDRSQIEKILKEFDAPAAAMATLYTGWKDAECEPYWAKVLADTNALDEARFKAMMVVGDRHYERGAVAQATNLYQMALNFTTVNRRSGADLERLRDRIAQEQFKTGMITNALALLRDNINSRNAEYRIRANLFHAREDIKAKEIRTLMSADRALRAILGQVTKAGLWTLDIKYSQTPVIRAMQNEAKDICEKYELDLAQQPMDEAGWAMRLRAKSKADFDRRLKAQ